MFTTFSHIMDFLAIKLKKRFSLKRQIFNNSFFGVLIRTCQNIETNMLRVILMFKATATRSRALDY
jgi:hypothetical protein